jgi:hypothetical protein
MAADERRLTPMKKMGVSAFIGGSSGLPAL